MEEIIKTFLLSAISSLLSLFLIRSPALFPRWMQSDEREKVGSLSQCKNP